jgi:hypothetical protein
MSAGHRAHGDAQLAGRDRDLVGVTDVTATRVALSKTTTALRAECPFGAVSTVHPAHWDRPPGGYVPSARNPAARTRGFHISGRVPGISCGQGRAAG